MRTQAQLTLEVTFHSTLLLRKQVTRKMLVGHSLVVWWLRLQASTCRGQMFDPWSGTKIPHAVQCGKKKYFSHKIYDLVG